MNPSTFSDIQTPCIIDVLLYNNLFLSPYLHSITELDEHIKLHNEILGDY